MFWWWKGTLYHCIWGGVPFSNSSRSLQTPESGKIKLLHRSHSVVVILTIHVDAATDEASDFSCHWSLDSLLLPTRFLRRTGHGFLRDWNMDKVHKVGWCIASALKATQRASKSSWFLACSSCFPVSPFAELLEEGCSSSDFVCMLCSVLRRGSVRKNPKHTVAWDMGRWKQILPALWAF